MPANPYEQRAAEARCGPVLERLRKRLLDLTASNTLLNYRHPKASSLRIVDEVPAQVFEALLGGGTMSFAGLPDPDRLSLPRLVPSNGLERLPLADSSIPAPPTSAPESVDPRVIAREERRAAQARRESLRQRVAVEVGIDPSYELPAQVRGAVRRHQDARLQTLLFPEELEEQLRKIGRLAEAFIEETGANRLHMLLGFVEWSESGRTAADRVARLAPLVLMPVRLKRGQVNRDTHTFGYAVERTGEDWSANVTLQEKCRSDFAMALPDVDLEADESLEHYFARVEEVLGVAQPTWRLRRCITLGLVSFGKILMWRDLDPRNWPADRPLFASAPFRELLGAAEDHGGQPVATNANTDEYPLDTLASSGTHAVPPIVIDADSSQHSALVDVMRGVNLVLQGPPGTGKSQTIANMIAAALKEGKRVLFVAEKRAALDVVYRRLKGAGLADYCLALHSHTSAKKEFLADLEDRVARRGALPAPRDLEALSGRHSAARDTLNAHVDRMHLPFGVCELTPFEILWCAQRLTGQLGEDLLASIKGMRMPKVVRATLAEIERRHDVADDFAGAFSGVNEESGGLADHPWAGVENEALSFTDVNDVLDAAHALRDPLQELRNVAGKLEALLGVPVVDSAQALRSVRDNADRIEPLEASASEDLPHLIVTASAVPHVRAAVAAVETARACWAAITGPWSTPGALDAVGAAAAEQVLDLATAIWGVQTPVADVQAAVDRMSILRQKLESAESAVEHLVDALGIDPARITIASAPVLVDIVQQVESLELLSHEALDLRSDATADEAAMARLRTIFREADKLRDTRRSLDARFAPSLRPDTTLLRETAKALAAAPRFLPTLFSSVYRRATRAYRIMAGGRRESRELMLQGIHALLAYGDATAKIASDPLVLRVFGDEANGIDSPFSAAFAAAGWHLALRNSTVALGEDGRAWVKYLWTAPTKAWREALERMRVMPTQFGAAKMLREMLDADETSCTSMDSHGNLSSLAEVRARLSWYKAAGARVAGTAASAGVASTATLAEVRRLLDLVREAWRADDALAEQAHVLASIGIPMTGVATDVAPVKAALEYIGRVQGAALPAQVASWLLGPMARTRLTWLRDHGDHIAAAVAQFDETAGTFASLAVLDVAAWCAVGATKEERASLAQIVPLTLRDVLVETLIVRLDLALGRPNALHAWATYRRSRALAVSQGMGQLVALVEAGRIKAAETGDAYEAIVFRSLAEAVLAGDRDLDGFDSGRHSEVQKRFVRLDEELLQLTQQDIAHALSRTPPVPGHPGPRVSDMSDEALLRHQFGLQRRHLAIRELFRRSGRAIQSLKPCFLMGPQAVAQYLAPGKFEFDIVVMDEASQMRPEDAMGAIARSRQVVIVGDPMQLGPTRFFDQADSDEDWEEPEPENGDEEQEDNTPVEAAPPLTGATVLERSESILLAAAACFSGRMLRWHYRSRHPKLIAFSNREFYNERLIVFPTPGGLDEQDGVFLRRVDGVYGGSRNLREAQAIVAAIRTHARDYPDRTLLVASMNAPQADLIDGLLVHAEKEDETLAAYLKRHADTMEPFSIKNLENVQGDERDVIFVSVTYGPNEAGRIMQNFGPILTAGGERRLNVLFTRAKHRLEVFCSFDANNLRVQPSSARGLRVLRDYLRFAAGEVWWAAGTETGRDPDSDFEIAIADALRARGYETRPQIGVAGYFIDMAVVDPDAPGRFILGIEADGATYHSAKTARDRDRLRQSQLEALGWTIHRVWSTDFFRDPVGQVNRIVARIEALRRENAAATA